MGSVNIECREVNDISTRVGKVVFSREMLMKSTEEELLAIFSNLFPLLIQDDHSKGLMEQKAYYGYSPYFRKLEQGQNHLNIQCGLRELKVVKSFLIDLKK